MHTLQVEFQQLKADYSNNRKEHDDIIHKMQTNLKKRTNKTNILCLDGKTYQINSDKVEDLYAIDGILSAEAPSQNMTNIGNDSRERMEQVNKYSSSNLYNKQ